MEDFDCRCSALRRASRVLSLMTAERKNNALGCVAKAIERGKSAILDANTLDMEAARRRGVREAMLDRLLLDDKRIEGMLSSIDAIIMQKDPIGEELCGWQTPKGMTIRQVRVPLGVAAIIYEGRPNVTLEAFSLCYKSGNAVLLRGSSSAYETNRAIVNAIQAGLIAAGADGVKDAISLMPSKEGEHKDVDEILNAVGKIDVVVPRGGKGLIEHVVSNARVPCIETGSGVCHLYVDETADMEMAVKIAVNAKMSRPSVCNAIECILVHRSILSSFLPKLHEAFGGKVSLRADEKCLAVLRQCGDDAQKASSADYGHEFLDYICAICAVGTLDEAVDFINAHGTGHSECIITASRASARAFQERVDASCVYVNASTRFTDGGEFGFGAELGISTQKLHARGPMGVEALTTTKYLIDGDGQIR